jgi:hypothetical protein
MMHKEEGGGSPQIKVDIQRRLIVHVTMHVIAPTGTITESPIGFPNITPDLSKFHVTG